MTPAATPVASGATRAGRGAPPAASAGGGSPGSTPGAGGRGPARRRLGIGVLFAVAALAVLAAALGGGRAATTPYDPTSTAPDGARGLALLIGRLGGHLDTSGALPPPGHGVVMVLADHLTTSGRAAVLAWVRDGGTLVVADPTSDLAGVSPAEGPTPDSGVPGSGPTAPSCQAPWVAGVDRIDLPATALLATPPGAVQACFGPPRAHFAVERREGRGAVVALASPDLWTNQHLASLADSVLAADLLVPAGDARTAWLSGEVGGGRQGLLSTLPGRVWELLAGALLAVLVLAAGRARRLGRPVEERLPVVVPGSELVEATGRLLARNGQRARASELLRAGAAEDLAAGLAVPLDGTAPLIRRLAQVTGRDPGELATLLDGPPPPDDAALVALAEDIDRLRQEVARAR
jgi:hypothetical protein